MAWYQDCSELQNQLRNETGYWDTTGWADDVGGEREILFQYKSCVVFLDRPDNETSFALIGNEDVLAWIDIVKDAFGTAAADGEATIAEVGRTDCAGTTLEFQVDGADS
ncbi:hypothetical protein PG994_014260 [Apiospora phragmitis]|uniref:Ecp2 effector protein-like domain-containing protein n=1 Tax=Apiospora phragmitis TaxID=2905665 RepID=A0ABR1T669_9PEZI